MKDTLQIDFNGQSLGIYKTAPDDGEKHPGLVVIHEVWGLTDHVKDVADRFAAEGYVVYAPDLLSQTGIPEKVNQSIMADMRDPEKRAAAQVKMREVMAPIREPKFGEETVARLKKVIDEMINDESITEQISVVGYCFGGTYAYALACEDNRLFSIVPYYGHSPEPLDKIKNISCPVLAFYGDKDENLMKTLPELQQKMDEYEKNFESVVYPGAGHAFFNDTNPITYNQTAAEDAWAKTLAFLNMPIA